MTKYWFARRFPLGSPRSAMAPVSREGWLVMAGFVAAMAAAAIVGLLTAASGAVVPGLVLFVAVAAVAGAVTVWLASGRGDARHTVDDYRAGRVAPPRT